MRQHVGVVFGFRIAYKRENEKIYLAKGDGGLRMLMTYVYRIDDLERGRKSDCLGQKETMQMSASPRWRMNDNYRLRL